MEYKYCNLTFKLDLQTYSPIRHPPTSQCISSEFKIPQVYTKLIPRSSNYSSDKTDIYTCILDHSMSCSLLYWINFAKIYTQTQPIFECCVSKEQSWHLASCQTSPDGAKTWVNRWLPNLCIVQGIGFSQLHLTILAVPCEYSFITNKMHRKKSNEDIKIELLFALLPTIKNRTGD